MSEPTDPPKAVLWLLRGGRLLMLGGIGAILVAATMLLVFSVVGSVKLLLSLAEPAGDKALMLASIKLVDLVLLATVLYVTAIGLYELFIDSRIPLPPWLVITTIDDLKHKLIGVIVTILGVSFLEKTIAWSGDRDVLYFGGAIALVVGALTFFLMQGSTKK